MSWLRELGVTISIDDFGAGYSCLACFKDIPADELKIDKSFVSRLLNDTASADIATLIVDLAHRFGLTVVGEGIENEATLRALQQRQCDVLQDYFFCDSLEHAEFAEWLLGWGPGTSGV